MSELNRNLGDEMGYGLDKSGCVAFRADYHFQKNGPDDDPELEGFCEMIGKTAPARLDEIVGIALSDIAARQESAWEDVLFLAQAGRSTEKTKESLERISGKKITIPY